MKSKLLKSLVILIGALALIVPGLVMVREVSMIYNWSHSGFTLCSLKAPADKQPVQFYGVVKEDFVAPPYPAAGDTLLTIDDSTATERRWIDRLEVRHTPGREVRIQYLHNGQPLTATIRTRAVQPALLISVFSLQALKLIIFLAFLLVGFWAFLKRPNSAAVRVLALYCFAMVTFMANTHLPMYPDMGSFKMPWPDLVRGIVIVLGAFFSAYWLLLNLLFPRPSAMMFRRPWLGYTISLVPVALVVGTSTVLFRLYQVQSPWLQVSYFAICISQIIAGIVLLWRHFRHAANHMEQRQTRLVLLGSAVELVLFVVFLVDPLRFLRNLQANSIVTQQIITNVVFLLLLLSPITLAYAFGRYRLLDVEAKLRRGTRYAIALIILVGLVGSVIYVSSESVTDYFGRNSQIGFAVVVLLMVAISFGARRTKRALEERFFPERRRLHTMIQDFLQRTSALADKQLFWDQLESRLREALAVEAVYPVVLGSHNGNYLLRDDSPTPFHTDSVLMRWMETERRPMMTDEVLCCDRVDVQIDERSWLAKNRIALILPMLAHGRLVGFLGLGTKTEQEDYRAEELQILDSLAPQFALATDNIRLLEENVDKRRLEEQLQVARRVQQGFLPKELPQVAGLELAALSNFCYEVAGDYYDVIPLDDGRTVLAVGDVSGKGAGAALLMANLQASLRALCTVKIPLAEMVSRINEIIYRNTESEQFITFFAGIYDPRLRTLDYVNAGHNAPYLFRPMGNNELLEVGGLILGAFHNATYQQASVQLEAGDLLLLYTDGVSEAMNAAEEELGEVRLYDVTRQFASQSSSVVLQQINDLVAKHQGPASVEDDQTLLVVKVIN